MCWVSKRRPKLLIAKKDRVCYKMLTKTLRSPHRNYQYCFDIPNTVIDLQTEICYDEFRCYRGYHSYASLEDALLKYKLLKIFDPSIYLFKCIIPKGSQYLINRWQEIVSSNIIITNKIFE